MITHSPCLLIQIKPHVDGFHMPAISHRHTLLSGVFCFVLLIWPAVILSVFCALCHGEYPYLTQLIRPFILMEFTLSPPAFSLTKTELFARVVGGVGRQSASNKLLVGRHCKYSLPLSIPKGYKCAACKTHWFRL